MGRTELPSILSSHHAIDEGSREGEEACKQTPCGAAAAATVDDDGI